MLCNQGLCRTVVVDQSYLEQFQEGNVTSQQDFTRIGR